MSDIREHIADENASLRLNSKVMVEEDIGIVSDEHATVKLSPSTATHSAPVVAGEVEKLDQPVTSVAFPADLARRIGDTEAEVDGLESEFGTRLDEMAEDQRVMLEKVAEIYRFVLKGNKGNACHTSPAVDISARIQRLE